MVSGNVYFDGVCGEFGFLFYWECGSMFLLAVFGFFRFEVRFLWYFLNFLGFMLEFLVGNRFFCGVF